MKNIAAFCCWSVLLLAGVLAAEPPRAATDGLALTPPMGWYPWNGFGEAPQNEKLIKEIVDALVSSGMKDAGYTYVGPDEGICFERDAAGKLTTVLARYPSGLRGLGDYIHQHGLKYALYTDAGTTTCSGGMPGTLGHEVEDMASFAEWRADYLKIDWCNTEKGQNVEKSYTKLGKAKLAAGRPIVHSLCSWGRGEPWQWAAGIGHLWRTTEDICTPGVVDFRQVMRIIAKNEPLYAAAGPGHWNDPDMLVVGLKNMTDARTRTHFSLWCMMAAPLIAGNDLRNMKPATLQVLTNMEAIGINQDPLGVQGRIVRKEGGETIVGGGKSDHAVEIWAGKPLFDGSQALLVYNRATNATTIAIKTAEVGLAGQTTLFARDLWEHTTAKLAIDAAGSFAVTVKPGDVRFLRIAKANDFPLPPVIVADTYLVSLRATGQERQKPTGAITLTNKGSSELPLWKVRPDLPAWLSVDVTKRGRTQTVINTVTATGLKKGACHAIVRLDNTEPISGKPMSAIYYDVDLEIVNPQ